MVTKILLIEDDERVRAAEKMVLEDEGYNVFETSNAESAIDAFDGFNPDVVIVDLVLPHMSGFECTRLLRSRSLVPIVVVSARSDTHDVVAGLEAGADDYLTKPFEVKELTARIRALLRRAAAIQNDNSVIKIKELEIRQDEGIVLKDGMDVHLTRTEFRLLCELASKPGRVLSREQLLERVWGYDWFGDGRLVDAHVRRLRTKLETDSSDPEYVLTVRGLGYRLDM